jgi:protein required for attachment to host cells
VEEHKKDNGQVKKQEDDNDDDGDELDAFMAEINKQAQKEVHESKQKVLLFF